jgi:hypothetical protein
MGTIQGGVLGGFNGKVGAVVGSHWKGKAVMRGRPTGKRGKSTPAQLEQQAKFSLMVNFLLPIVDFLNLSYKNLAKQMTGFNKALSGNIQLAVAGVYPNFTIDFTKVNLSKGSLTPGDSPAAASTAAGTLVFTWKDNSKINNALSSDIVFVAAYNDELKHWIFNDNAATRNAATFTLDVTSFSGKPAQTYIGFMSADGKKVSNSVYTGAVNIL